MLPAPINGKLARALILDELFDLSLYQKLRRFVGGDLVHILDELIPIETKHFGFWQKFFDIKITRLDFSRRIKLSVLVLFCRIFGRAGTYLVLESIETHGIRKYLRVWEVYKDGPLGEAIRRVLEDEFKHEDEIVSEVDEKKINPERVRDIFLGFNDGLVEILGAVSGFFAAFQTISSVLVAGLTVAIAGAISMAAGAYAAISSEKEVGDTEAKKRAFIENKEIVVHAKVSPMKSSFVVGVSYFIGSMVPILPVLFGAENILVSVLSAIVMVVIVSYLVAFVSGMNVGRRIGINLVIIVIAVSVTYGIGIMAKNVWGISI